MFGYYLNQLCIENCPNTVEALYKMWWMTASRNDQIYIKEMNIFLCSAVWPAGGGAVAQSFWGWITVVLSLLKKLHKKTVRVSCLMILLTEGGGISSFSSTWRCESVCWTNIHKPTWSSDSWHCQSGPGAAQAGNRWLGASTVVGALFSDRYVQYMNE